MRNMMQAASPSINYWAILNNNKSQGSENQEQQLRNNLVGKIYTTLFLDSFVEFEWAILI